MEKTLYSEKSVEIYITTCIHGSAAPAGEDGTTPNSEQESLYKVPGKSFIPPAESYLFRTVSVSFLFVVVYRTIVLQIRTGNFY